MSSNEEFVEVDGKKFKNPNYRSSNSNAQEIRVSVDSSQMETMIHTVDDLKKENKELKQQVAEAEPAIENLENEKEILAVQLTANNVPTEAADLKSAEEVERAKATVVALRKAKGGGRDSHVPAGTVPLSSQQAVQQKKGFGSYEEMIQDVSDKAALGSVEAKEVMKQLIHKTMKGTVEGRLILPAYQEPEKQSVSSEFGETLKLSVKSDPLGLKTTYRRRKLKRLAMEGDETAQRILDSGAY